MGGIKNGSNDRACLDVRQRVVRGSTVTADHRIPGTEIRRDIEETENYVVQNSLAGIHNVSMRATRVRGTRHVRVPSF